LTEGEKKANWIVWARPSNKGRKGRKANVVDYVPQSPQRGGGEEKKNGYHARDAFGISELMKRWIRAVAAWTNGGKKKKKKGEEAHYRITPSPYTVCKGSEEKKGFYISFSIYADGKKRGGGNTGEKKRRIARLYNGL